MALSALYGSGRDNETPVTPEMIDSIVSDFNPEVIYGLLNQSDILLIHGDRMGGASGRGVEDRIKRDSEELLRMVYTNLTRKKESEGFGIPHNTVLKKNDLSAVILSNYATGGYVVVGGALKAILSFRIQKYPGVLYFQSNSDGSADNVFGSFTIDNYNKILNDVQVINPGDDPQTLERLLNEAATQMESGNPRFMYSTEDCSPLPNFMRSDQYPKIAKLIRDNINNH